MLKNTEYNLMEEITTLSQGLYRYDTYIEDAKDDQAGCADCSEMWMRMKERHEQDLKTLLQKLRHHTDTGMLDQWGPLGQ